MKLTHMNYWQLIIGRGPKESEEQSAWILGSDRDTLTSQQAIELVRSGLTSRNELGDAVFLRAVSFAPLKARPEWLRDQPATYSQQDVAIWPASLQEPQT
jgi:hypothetical protein